MNKLHEKSPCCRGRIRRFGKRRRQCSVCHKTWRVWKKKLGRRANRPSFSVLFQHLDNQCLTIKAKIGLPARRARTRIALEKFVAKRSWYPIAEGPLIAIADALPQRIKGEVWTVYFILLRPINSNKAVIAPPFIQPGTESGSQGWEMAFSNLSSNVKNRVVGLVCDGRSPLITLSKKENWILQRCHFHLLYRIANYSRTGIRGRNRPIAFLVKSLVNIILTNKNEKLVKKAVLELKCLQVDIHSQGLRRVLSGFIKHYSDFRSYLYRSELNLPNTSNGAESLIGKIRSLQYRAKGFRSKQSFMYWITALCKHQKFIICNGHKIQPN